MDKIEIETTKFILTGSFRKTSFRAPLELYNWDDFKVTFKWNGWEGKPTVHCLINMMEEIKRLEGLVNPSDEGRV